ncbi:MAG: hypothetical protein LLG40_09055 [Deltaproteobacteria bacterium]|nr:hypothetical protein [Deltaproteobacteria bacterium]
MNKRFRFEYIAAIFLMVSLSGITHAAQSTVGARAVNTNPAQSTSVTTKPLQQPVTNQATSMKPCANYCEKGMMVQQQLAPGGCKQTSSYSCFPYTCNYQGTLCHTSCSGNVQCATPNAYCNMATKQCVAGNNCPSKCEGDNTVGYIPTSMMPNSSTCKKDKTTSCFPYSCDPQSGSCRNNCTSDQQCAAGAMCSETKSCVPAYNHCDKNNPNYLILVDRSKVACDPYLCRGNACLTNCDKAADCIEGFVCDTGYSRTCVPK